MRYRMYAAFISPDASTGLLISIYDGDLNRNDFVTDGATLLFSEMTPLAALHKTLVITKKVQKSNVEKTLTVARYVASYQGSAQQTLKNAVVRTQHCNTPSYYLHKLYHSWSNLCRSLDGQVRAFIPVH